MLQKSQRDILWKKKFNKKLYYFSRMSILNNRDYTSCKYLIYIIKYFKTKKWNADGTYRLVGMFHQRTIIKTKELI